MKIKDLIRSLKSFDQDTEIHINQISLSEDVKLFSMSIPDKEEADKFNESISRPIQEIVLTDLEITCGACPSQWEGETVEGKSFYARYRWGFLRVDINGETVFSINYGDDNCGVMDTDEMCELANVTLKEY